MDSLQGHLLVASPHLPDPNFFRSVVLIVEHQDEGALGVILNRVAPHRLEDAWKTACESECRIRDYLRVGGPVDGPLMALYADPELEGHEVIPGIYFSSESSVLKSLVTREDAKCRIFSGYAGWGSGQLDEEMRVGGWLTLPASADYIFDREEESLWQRAINAIGHEITRSTLNLRHVPEDPRCN